MNSEVIDGVLVKDEREQRNVGKYLEELYEFPSEKDYQDFLDGFIVRDDGKGSKDESRRLLDFQGPFPFCS